MVFRLGFTFWGLSCGVDGQVHAQLERQKEETAEHRTPPPTLLTIVKSTIVELTIDKLMIGKLTIVKLTIVKLNIHAYYHENPLSDL